MSVAIFAAAILAFSVVANKAGSIVGALSSARGVALILVSMIALAALASVAARRRARFWRALAASVSALVLIFVAAEIALRAIAAPAEFGQRIGTTALLPHDWNEVRRRNLQLLEHDALYVEDSLVGWDLGADRASADGMYLSSAEGIRSHEPGYDFSADSKRQRIALAGDSFTFGEEVPFEETWGHYLEQLLPRATQVLNFGVPSHGVDQTLLKFKHKVRSWRPRLVILGVLNGAAPRSGNVYLFLRAEQHLPFSKPRFVWREGGLHALNVPTLAAREIYAVDSISNLPLLQHETFFSPSHWQDSWLDSSYSMRYLFSRFPRWESHAPELSDGAITQLTVRLLEAFASEVASAGAKLLIVYLPVRADIEGKPAKYKDEIFPALAANGLNVLDPTACLLGHVPAPFIEGGTHYTAEGNAALAQCLLPAVLEHARDR